MTIAGPLPALSQLIAHCEAVEVGNRDIEQDDFRFQHASHFHRTPTVRGLADDVETLRLKQQGTKDRKPT